MMRYWTSSVLWLSLEEFTNRGLTQERARAIIEQIPDPGSTNLSLRCNPTGLNRNLRIETQSNDPSDHAEIVRIVEAGMLAELAQIQEALRKRNP